MTHARTQIRQAVVTLLKGNTAAGHNVFEARVYALDDSQLPALLIYTKQETVGQTSMSYPRTQQRQLQLTVEVYVKARGKVDQDTDALAQEIEQLLAADPSLGGLVKDMVLDTTETMVSDEGEKPIAIMILNYAVLYTVKENAPHTLV